MRKPLMSLSRLTGVWVLLVVAASFCSAAKPEVRTTLCNPTAVGGSQQSRIYPEGGQVLSYWFQKKVPVTFEVSVTNIGKVTDAYDMRFFTDATEYQKVHDAYHLTPPCTAKWIDMQTGQEILLHPHTVEADMPDLRTKPLAPGARAVFHLVVTPDSWRYEYWTFSCGARSVTLPAEDWGGSGLYCYPLRHVPGMKVGQPDLMLREHGETAFTGMHQYDMRQIHYQGFSLEFADMQTKVYDVRITNDGTIVDRYKLHCETQYSWPIYDAKAPPWQVRWFDKKTGQEIPLRPNDTWGERAASLQTPAMKPGEAHEYRLEVTPRVTTGNTYFSVFAESISDPGNYDVLTATCNIHIRVSCDLWVHTDDGKIAGKGTRLRHEDFSCEIPAPGTKTIYFTVLNDCEFTTDFYIGFDSFWQCTWKAVYGPNNTPEDSFGTACIRTPVLKPGESYTVRALVTAPAKYEQFERKIISASAGPVIRGADELIDSNTAFLYPNKHLSVLSPPPGPEVKLEANPGSGAVAGTTVTLTASPTLNDAYEYSFYIDEGTGWRCVRPYDRATMYHWTPVNAGTYGLRVCLRKAGGSAEDASATIPGYVVTNPPVTADNPPPVVTFR